MSGQAEPTAIHEPARPIAATCNWCGSPSALPAWPGAEPPDFQVRRCTQCGHHYTVPVLGPREIGAYYAEEYYGAKNKRFNPVMEALVGWFRGGRARMLTRLAGEPGRAGVGKVLDVGCGRGLTLATLRTLGWRTQGCEYSATSSRYAREVLELDVVCDGFDPARYADGEFEAVSFWHVLEHMADPRQTLETCARIVKPGGVLAIAVPNFESYQAQAARYGWFHLDMPRHYSHFSASWLRKRFAELGFEVVSEFHGSAEQNPYGWIQSLENRWGLRRNLLYDVLRSESARTVKRPWTELPGQALASLVGLAILLPFSLAMLLPEIVFRRGGTVEFYAVRKPSAAKSQG
ncbi:MAG: class I SAM-dependent methyltransferase [Planctomycetaceae bacterium]|nr:class I SAM-dependent methyltransferase [Planctomycetaceae bacterium]